MALQQNLRLPLTKRKSSRALYKIISNTETQLKRSSLYLTNLPDKLQKADLRLSLYTLFSTYGPVLDVVALSRGKMRGQAHVAFRDVQASTQAMRALQGFDFFGKEMVRLYVTPTRKMEVLLRPGFRKSNTRKANQMQLQSWMVHTKCLSQSAVKS